MKQKMESKQKNKILFTVSQTQQMKTSALDVLLTTFQVNVSLLFVFYIIIIIFLYFFFAFVLYFIRPLFLAHFFSRNLTRYRYWQSEKLHKQTTWTILNSKCVNIMILNKNQWIVNFWKTHFRNKNKNKTSNS